MSFFDDPHACFLWKDDPGYARHDFTRWEEVVGTFPPLPSGLVWAHHVDRSPTVAAPEMVFANVMLDARRGGWKRNPGKGMLSC